MGVKLLSKMLKTTCYDETTKIAVVTIDSKDTSFKDFEYFKFSDDTSAMTIAEAVSNFAESLDNTPYSVADLKAALAKIPGLSISWKADDFDFLDQSDTTPFTQATYDVAKVIAVVTVEQLTALSFPIDGNKVKEEVLSGLKKQFPTESISAISVVNSGTSASPVLDFYLDASKDPGGDGVGSFDVTLSFDPAEATYNSFSFASGLIGNANDTDASAGKITVGAIALPNFTNLSTPLFTMNMTDLDTSADDFAIYISGVSVDGTALDGTTSLIA